MLIGAMSRYQPDRDTGPILEAASRWAGNCLVDDRSILSEGERLWTPQHFDELDHAFVQNYDDGEGSFMEKLQRQLAPTRPAARKLMGEALWILMLFQSKISADRKRSNITAVWSWSGDQLDPGNPMLSDAVLGGLGSPGTAYNTQRWRELSFLLTAFRAFKGKPPRNAERLLSDAAQFASWFCLLPEAKNRQFRHICLYLLFPDEFERISTGADKRSILAAFIGEREKDLKRWDDARINRALLNLRQRLEAEQGAPFDFYEANLVSRWRGAPRAWLLSWNPEHWPWESLSADRAATARGEP